MPKIAAALAVFLTVVTCIGYNSARYPVVWEMVALSDGFTRSRRSEPSAPFPESTDSPQSEGLATAASPGESAARRQSDWSSQDDSATARKSTTTRPSSPYASYRDGGSSYADDDSTYADEGGSYADERSSYANEGSGYTDYGSSYRDEGRSYNDSSYDDSSYANDGPSGANDYSSYGNEGYSYDDSSYADESTSDAAEKDEPAERVAMRQKPQRRAGRPEAHGSRYAVDPVAPLSGSNTSGRWDDRSAVGTGDVADEGDVSTQGLSAAERTAGPASEPVRATAGAKYASSPPGTVSPSSDASTYSDPDSHSTDSTQEGPAGESTADATARGTLVPIKPAGPGGHGCEPPGGRSPGDALVAVASGDSTSTCRVERLPPVDQVATLPGARPLDPHDALPVYPSTGGE